MNLTRFYGVFAPNSLHRVWVTPARRGKGSRKVAADQDEKTRAQPHVAMSLKHNVSSGCSTLTRKNLPSLRCCGQGGRSCASCAHGIRASMHIIACIEDAAVISKILNHLEEQSPLDSGVQISASRAPPQARLFS